MAIQASSVSIHGGIRPPCALSLGFSPYPQRHRPSSLYLLLGDSVPAASHPHSRRHRVHRRAFDHADRLGLQLRSRFLMVSAADRNPHRRLDRLHGPGKYRRRRQRAAPLDDGLRLWPGARIWFLLVLRQSLQFAGSHLFTSLLSFNVGVELGQLLVLMLLIPVLQFFFRFAVAERMGIIILSALVASYRLALDARPFVTLRQFRFEWPALDAMLVAMALRWLMLLLILAGVLWLFQSALRWWNNRAKPEARAPAHPVSYPIPDPTETSISVERPN